MKYVSTRNFHDKFSAADAIAMGLARDGGLFMPEAIPHITAEDLKALCGMTYAERAVQIMKRFLDDFSAEELADFAANAYAVPAKFDAEEVAPVVSLNASAHILELWHGPTCAFKDMALQMLPYLLTASLKKNGETRTVYILVATSGDTGKAALEGFCDVPQTKILVFYPRDGVSNIQKLQMVTQSGANVGVCAVEGNFDDAQTGVKKIFNDEQIRADLDEKGYFLSSANSINWGRLLPQVVYYFSSYCDLVNRNAIALGDSVNFCVPTGNFGDILSGYFAKEMGLPAHRLICASNSNDVLTEFIRTGKYDSNRQFYMTTSPSMDILVSSNVERLLAMLSSDTETAECMTALNRDGVYRVPADVLSKIQQTFSCGCCDDRNTLDTIQTVFQSYHYLMDTHTAVAYRVYENYKQETGDETPTVILSTASPYKFTGSVLKAFQKEAVSDGPAVFEQLSELTDTAVPAPLAALKDKKPRFSETTPKDAMRIPVMGLITT